MGHDINMNSKFIVDIGSDTDFEDLIAILYYGEYFIGIISQEEGFENLKIHLHIGQEFPLKVPFKTLPTMNLQEFEEAIQKAKKRLWELRRDNPLKDESE